MELSKETIENRKNRNFTQVYPKGWQRITALSKITPYAVGLYSFFAENIDASCGAVICTQDFLAKQFNVTTRTVRSWIKALESQGALIKIPVSGRLYAYALNPNEVWKGFDTSKDYAAFASKTLIDKDGEIKRRLKVMSTGQQDLPLN